MPLNVWSKTLRFFFVGYTFPFPFKKLATFPKLWQASLINAPVASLANQLSDVPKKLSQYQKLVDLLTQQYGCSSIGSSWYGHKKYSSARTYHTYKGAQQ